MAQRPTAAPGELDALRSRTLAELEHQHALQRIDAGELARRTERALEASSAHDLRPLVADLLESFESEADEHGDAPATVPASADTEPDHDWAFAIMSGSNRSGQWEPAEHVTALSIMGGIRLDFREALLLEGVATKVSAFCVMGGIEILVPPDVHVSVAGTGLMGGFEHVKHTAAEAGAPHIHITGIRRQRRLGRGHGS